MSGDKQLNGDAAPASSRSTSQFALEEIIRPVAIAAMMACIAAAIANFITSLIGEWASTFFVILTFVVSLESIHAQRLINKRDPAQRDVIRFRFVEWVVILLLIRFGIYIKYGYQRLLQDMSTWGQEINTFFDAAFMMNSLLILLFWGVALYLSRAVQELESSPFEKPPVVTDPDFYLRTTIPQHGQVDRRSRIRGIVAVFFAGGALMIALAGLAQMDVRILAIVASPRTPVILNIMIYYLIGLLLISQVQYTTLRANWDIQGITVARALGRRWLLYVIIFLGLVGLISALLPVNYSVGIVATISIVVRWIAYAVLQAIYFIIAAVTFIFMYIGSLVSRKPAAPVVVPTPLPTPLPPDTTAGIAAPATWVQIARSLLFWGILVAVSGYAIIRFLNDRWDLFNRLKGIRLFGWLFALFGGLGRGSAQLWQSLRNRLQQQIAAVRNPARSRRRMRRTTWRQMSTRERVRFLYLALVEDAAEQGLVRPIAATPQEYEVDLTADLPEGQEPAHHLTQSFVEARYSEHTIDDELVALAQQDWRAVKHALSARKRALAQQKAREREQHG